MKLVVVLPTYNEATNLPQLVPALFALGIEGLEVVVVDDHSPDGTGHIADQLATDYRGRVHVVHRASKLGLGTAYRQGIQYALAHGATVVVQMDADFSHSPSYLPEMLQKINDYDVIVGSRYVAGGGVDTRWEFWRRVLSRGGNAYARLMTGLRVCDATSGFRVFRREVLEHIGFATIRSQGYAFHIEMALASQNAGYRICEVPIFFHERMIGQSKLGMKVVWEAMWRVWQIRRVHLRMNSLTAPKRTPA